MKKIWIKILFVILAIVTLVAIGIIKAKKVQEQDLEVIVNEIPESELFFGLPVDSFIISEGTIKRNQNLSEILTSYGVEMVTIDLLARNSREIFDVRKIKSGNQYYVFQTPDSIQNALYFIYESSPFEYVQFELFDSLNIAIREKEIVTELKFDSGIIESSLWETMLDNNINPILANKLSDIFAWTIDFFGIQKGDRFRVIYEEQYVDGEPVDLGDIHGVEFEHMGQSNFAFRFFQDGRYDFFDEEGNSLRKTFLKAPLSYSRVSSGFSYSRYHPILKIRRPHLGVDYAAPAGTPVQSIGDGTVVERGYEQGGGGNYLKIKHNSVYTTIYMHLSGFAKGIVTGTRVNQAQVIGYVGSTGLATGPHLDFRVYMNGLPIDPLTVDAPPVEPVVEENFDQYMVLKDSMIHELNTIYWQTELASTSVH